MTRTTLLIFWLLFSQILQAQYFKVSGKITNNKLEPLALVTVQIKGQQTGTLSREDGSYQLELEEGTYDLVITMVGFKGQVINLVVNKDYVQNVILEPDESINLSEVVITSKIKDRSDEIIRNVIRNKENILAAAGAYSCNAYIKATQQDSVRGKKKAKNSLPDSILAKNADLQQMTMAEISLHYDHEADDRIKEERTGVVKRGDPEGLFYLSTTEGNFNLYNNLIKAPALSEVPFLSPISYSGLSAYKYKVIHTRLVAGRKIYTITIKPRQLSNVTVEGELTVLDSAWTILTARYVLPGYHIPAYDFFEVDQQYSFVDNKAWMITRQQFTYYSKHGKGKLSGETLVSYKDFEFNKAFPKKYFGKEVSATAQEAYERDSSFWEKTRTEPLTQKEIRFIRYKDSLYRVTNSKTYLDSIDRITNQVTWKKLLVFGQIRYNREKEKTWYIPPVTSLYQPFQFGGGRLRAAANLEQVYKSKKNISLYGELSYGFRNHDVNGDLKFTKLYNPFNRAFYRFEVKREFAYIFEGDAFINMIKRNNFYLNNSIGIGHGQEIVNGLFLDMDFDMALRRSLSDYKTNPKIDSIFHNLLDNNQAVPFDPYNALYGQAKLQYTPGERYIREPKEKIILGSKWPTFYALWRKGIPGILKSDVNFDYLELGIQQELKLGTLGISKYVIKTGSFFNTKDLRLVDYKFQRRGDPWLFLSPNDAFQALDSSFALFHRFYQGNFIHEFNGAIINKIPFLKKLQLKEVAGGGFLVAPERNLRYGELFAGIERVFKWPFNPLFKFKIGVYVVGSVANQFRNPIQFKIGFNAWDWKRHKWL
ncbi:MAG: DUF5686 and carboxypeptidase regulatory-like domain-containing protein [Bacteroidota bacterium]|nr:DUF5686 and carboxypeptidase regulatory-like domain-containing protein [Bacteroidota bacterium]